jgi:hypothetical protein
MCQWRTDKSWRHTAAKNEPVWVTRIAQMRHKKYSNRLYIHRARAIHPAVVVCVRRCTHPRPPTHCSKRRVQNDLNFNFNLTKCQRENVNESTTGRKCADGTIRSTGIGIPQRVYRYDVDYIRKKCGTIASAWISIQIFDFNLDPNGSGGGVNGIRYVEIQFNLIQLNLIRN